MKPFPSHRGWRFIDYTQIAVFAAVGLWLHRFPLIDMYTVGVADPEQSHVFLAPLIAVYLLWLRRSRLRWVMRRPSVLGPIVAAAGWMLSWWGFQSGTQIAWHGGAALSLLGILISFTGLTPLRLFAPVFLVLIFVLPVPGELRHAIAYPLQELATRITHSTLEVIGISAIKSGNVLIINGERVAVGEACNGMRMVFALTLVVYAFAFAIPLKPATRILLVALSPAIAMACNVLRLVPTSLMFGYSSSEAAYRFHEVSGWIMLPAALIVLGLIVKAIRWMDFPVTRLRLATQ